MTTPPDLETPVTVERLAPDLVDELGDGWVFGPGHWSGQVRLDGPFGEVLYLKMSDDYRPRLIVRADSPDAITSHHRDELCQTATMATSKTPAQLAREITRRIITPYREQLPAAIERQVRLDADERDRERVRCEIERAAAPLGNVHRSPHLGHIVAGDSPNAGGLGSLTVEHIPRTGADAVTVGLRVPRYAVADVAAAVAAVLTARRCARCSDIITDAGTANLPADDSALCLACGDPS